MDLFSPYGEIISAKVSRDLATGNSKHYGFVQYKTAQAAAAAIANLNGRNLTPTNRLHVSVAKHDETRHSGECDRLYVRNLPLWVSREHLKGVFSEHGTVIEANVLGSKNRGSGAAVQLTVGFVRMSTVDEAKKCIRALHGSRAFDESSPVLIRFMENPTMKASRHTRKQQEQEEGDREMPDGQGLHKAVPAGSQVSANVGTPLFNSGPSSTTLSHSSTPATPVLYQVSPSTSAHQMSSMPFVVNGGGGSPSLTAYWNTQMIPSTAATAAYSSTGSIRHQVSPILIGTTSSPVVAAVLPTSGLLCHQSSEPSQSSPTIAVSTSSTPARPHLTSPFPSSGDLVFEGVYDEATLSYVIHRQTGCTVASYLSFDNKQYVRLTDPSAHWHVQHELNGKPMSNEMTLSVTIL
jgi:RNA recognition motif-containing protein